MIELHAITAALSTSASSQITTGLFPPNSRIILFRFDYELEAIILLPTADDPVNEIIEILGWFDIASPAIGPSPGTTFKTPLGNPASLQISANLRIVSGVTSDGFSTTQFPAAREGPNFHSAIRRGKFQGAMRPTTPKGSRRV